MGYLHSMDWSAGMEYWNGISGMESLEWSEALEWACYHFGESFRHD